MKIILPLASGLIFGVSTAYAGQIYGTLTSNGRSLNQQAQLQLACETGFRADRLRTDRYGAYRISVPGRGRCRLTVSLGHSHADATVYAYDQPVRYDFDLRWVRNSLQMRRR